MGCFCFGLSKLETYVRMRNYLRGKMEKRKEKKRQKELERLKREGGSAKDVAENSADVTSPVTTSDTTSRSNINRSPRNVDSSCSSGSNHSSRSQGNDGDINSGSSDKVSGGSEEIGSSDSSGSPIPISGGRNFCKKVSSDSDDDIDLTSFIQSSRDNTAIQVEEAEEEEDDIFTTNLRLRKIVSEPCDIQRRPETPEEVRKRQFFRGTASLLTAVAENPLPIIDEDSIYVSKTDFVMPTCSISVTEQRCQRDLKDGFGVFGTKP